MKIAPLLTEAVRSLQSSHPLLQSATDNRHNIRTFSNGNQCSCTVTIIGNNDSPHTHTHTHKYTRINKNEQTATNIHKATNTNKRSHMCHTNRS
jgi:hypothetical protein